MKVYNNITELIGNTPLLRLNVVEKALGLEAKIYAKVESFNPAGSAKDRVGLAMIKDAEEKGLLKPGATIIEPTSGNTGIGLAAAAASRGYKVILTMPDTMSEERRTLLKAYGAELVLTPGSEGMAGAINKANQLRDEIPGSIILQQFENPSNPKAHIHTTAEEIWRDTDGEIDIFVACAGTGGTLCGTSEGLKKHKASIQAIAVEPDSSPLLSGGVAGPHKIQGIGANFIPKNYNASLVDKIIRVTDDDAIRTSRLMAQKEGLLVGISSGASLYAAIQLAKQEENQGKTIVAILPDTGERYLSTELYAFDSYPL